MKKYTKEELKKIIEKVMVTTLEELEELKLKALEGKEREPLFDFGFMLQNTIVLSNLRKNFLKEIGIKED